MSPEDQVRRASQQFYAALNSMAKGDAGPMSDIWSHNETVSTMHPVGGREVGWDQVREPWQQVAQLSAEGQIILNDQLLQVSGDMAYEVGTEQGHFMLAGENIPVNQRVTNVYRHEAGVWKIVHHHADLSPAMVGVLSRLQSTT